MFGSVFGAGSRYAMSRYAAKVLSPDFPYGTLIINITGSMILGWFMIWTTEKVFADPRWRLIVAIGFCGSYTTFSSYAFESWALFEQGHKKKNTNKKKTSNALCLIGVLAGAALAR